ncbi:MAG: sterol desaturase family protein [Polyangiaceae bacterium]
MGDERALQPLWNWLSAELGTAFFAFPLHFLPTIVAVIAVTGVFFSVLDCIVYKKVTAREAWLGGLRTVGAYTLAAVALYALQARVQLWTVPPPAAAPSLGRVGAEVGVYMIVGELLTYGWHRVEHGSRFVFRYVHARHHSVRSPLTVWSNFVVHPVEGLMVMLCLYLPPLVMGAHPLVMTAYAIANTVAMVVTHSGYDFRLYPRWLLPAASAHELHHTELKPTNLSVVMTFGDKLFGTYKRPLRGL